MVLFNYAIREITAKIVYYGPGLGGKTTNLQHIHEKLDPGARGKLLSLATDGDRTLFFDFLPIEMGNIGGYKVRFQLYTVPGQVHYNATRKLVLKGVDAVAFVADSQVTMLERNKESFDNLLENLTDNGYDPKKVPIVIQINKRDLPDIAAPDELAASMGVEGYPLFEAVASRGDGVFETLKAVVKLTVGKLRTQFDGADLPAEEPAAEPPPPPPPSGVFAQPARSAAPSEAPPDPVPAPQPDPVGIADSPPPPGDEFEEFDLEGIEEAVGLGSIPAPDVVTPPPDGDIVDLEEESDEDLGDLVALDRESAVDAEEIEGLTGREAFSRAGTGGSADQGLDLDERRRAFFEEVQQEQIAPDVHSDPAAAALTESLPAWAGEILDEIRQLRAENRELRSALQGLAGFMDRQIDVLREGREALDRGIGATVPTDGE